MEGRPEIGRITIAPEVLVTTARLTTLAVPGVARLTSPVDMKFLQSSGVKIEFVEDKVSVKLYVVVDSDVNMLGVGRKIQAEVTRALQDMVGVEVHSVDVHVEDVAYSPSQ